MAGVAPFAEQQMDLYGNSSAAQERIINPVPGEAKTMTEAPSARTKVNRYRWLAKYDVETIYGILDAMPLLVMSPMSMRASRSSRRRCSGATAIASTGTAPLPDG